MAKGSSSCCWKFLVFLIFLILALGVVALVLWLLIRPNYIKSYAEGATLKEFAMRNNTLSYDLDVEFSVRNPNERVGVYYNRIDATASYDGYRFGVDDNLRTFYQGHENTSTISASFAGEQVVVDVGTMQKTFYRERADGFFHFDVKLDVKVRFELWSIKTNKYSPTIECTLRLPVPTSTAANSTDGAFSRTKCNINLDFFGF